MARVSAKVLAAKEANRIRQRRFLENHKDEVNEKRRERYAERKEEHKCPRCGKKLRSKKNILCKDCLEKAREYNQ
jgi:tRNA(Ile2) C34 agmatinyltransferase TiaS